MDQKTWWRSRERSSMGRPLSDHEKSMKRILMVGICAYAILTSLPGSLGAQAVVGNAVHTPPSSAALVLRATDRGAQLPVVALTSLTDNVTVPSPATGLLVYNNGSGGLSAKGVFVWNGARWFAHRMITRPSVSQSDFEIGEIRMQTTSVSTVDYNTTSTGVSKLVMTGKQSGDTARSTRKYVSEVDGTQNYIVFDSLRMDLLTSTSVVNVQHEPVLVNTGSSVANVSIAVFSSGESNADLVYAIAPQASTVELDNDLNPNVTLNGNAAMLTAWVTTRTQNGGNRRFYKVTWTMTLIDDGVNGQRYNMMTVAQRLQ